MPDPDIHIHPTDKSETGRHDLESRDCFCDPGLYIECPCDDVCDRCEDGLLVASKKSGKQLIVIHRDETEREVVEAMTEKKDEEKEVARED